MNFVYNILVHITSFFLRIAALFSNKLSLFVKGRKNVFAQLQKSIGASDRVIWFHTASLGEFEQGLPVIEQVRESFPQHKILVTFFSPSGYEVKKNSKAGDVITYLPLDTRKNAARFLDIVHPELAVFIKYEFWPNYLNTLQKRNIKTLLVSGIFRKEQAFFKPYGSWMRRSLKAFEHFFVQDDNSKNLLNSIGLTNVSVSGDTRFDRVGEILERNNTLDFVDDFKGNHLCVVCGSTWPEDEALLIPFINEGPEQVKYIIAPHNIKANLTKDIVDNLNKSVVLFSEKEGKDLSKYDVFVLDTIGILTKVYSYADLAYVGGGMGTKGLHNTLEPATFGIPVVIGQNYKGFKEAEELVSMGGILSIRTRGGFNDTFSNLIESPENRKTVGLINENYTKKNRGATVQILSHIRTLL